MKKVFDFIQSLKPSFYESFGYPTIKMYSDFAEVYFDTANTIRDLATLQIDSDEFRLFPSNTLGMITIVYTFYFEEENS